MAIETFWYEGIRDDENKGLDYELSELTDQLTELKWDVGKGKKKKKKWHESKTEVESGSESNENTWKEPEKEKHEEGREDEEAWEDKPEKSFTIKPVALNVWASTINYWENWGNGITTRLDFAWWGKNLSFFGYARKDWNEYAKGFNEWIELFANENLKLWKNFDLNGKQFYRWKGTGRLMVWPQLSGKTQLWKVEMGGSAWAYATYDFSPRQPGQEQNNNSLSWAWIFSVNVAVEQKNWKKWTWDAFLNVGWIKDFNYENYTTYWEANIKTPNLLDPKQAGQLCWWFFARYWWNIKKINLLGAWFWLTFNF